MNTLEKLNEISEKCKNCFNCPLGLTRTNVVFGRGSENAKIMFIGEAPGEKEDLSGEPFVGASGKLLAKVLEELGMTDYYIANIIKCRPPENRDPKPSEEDACIGFLQEQISVIKPEIIACLGRISAKRIIKSDFKITEEHGVFFDIGGVKACAIYHPAAVLRDPRKKADFMADMQKIINELNA